MSTVPVAKAAMLSLMETWTWPVASPQFLWGGPIQESDLPKAGELIYFGDTEITDESVVLGDTRRDETYDLHIVIDVFAYGNLEQSTETRVWQLYGSLVSLLNANRDLNGSINRLMGRTVTQTNIPRPEGWLSRIVVAQECVGFVFNP